jgi:hypothetical protein
MKVNTVTHPSIFWATTGTQIPIESGNFIFHYIFRNLGTKKPGSLKLHNFEKKQSPFGKN